MSDGRGKPEFGMTGWNASHLSRRDLTKRIAAATGLASGAVALLGEASSLRVLAQDSKPTGGSIVVARAGDSDTLDPAHTTAGIAFQVFTNIFDTLIAYDIELGYEGILAESWEISEDGLEYTFKLRPGIKFHDDTDLNAEAVKFTFDRLMLPETNAPAAGWITPLSSTEVVDDLTVKLVLSEPFSPLLGNLCLAYFGITSPAAVEQYGDADFGRNPVGTGPWKFQEWIAGEQITLVANETYQNHHTIVTNKGRPYADQLIFRNISEDATQIAAIETGEVTIIPMPAREVSRFEADDQFQLLIPERATNIWFLEFSMEQPTADFDAVFKPGFFEDARVRQAVAYAVNAEEIIESVFQGLAQRNYGLLPTGHFAYKPEIEEFGYHFDVEKAKALLDEAGWVEGDDGVRGKDGVKLEPLLWTWNAGNNERAVQVIQNQLAAVGFAVKIETMEIASLFAQQAENISDFDLMSWGWPEPHVMKMMVDGEAALGLYRRAEYIDLVDEAARVSEQADRTELYFQANQVALTDLPAIPLWTNLTPVGARAELKDFKLGPTGTNIYEDAYFES
jgi:peptide/nickel transport system substrate-binding protein